MLQLIRILLFSIFLSFPLISFADCPNTKIALESQDINTIKTHVKLLLVCNQYKDSLAMAYHDLGRFYYNVNLDSSIYYTGKALEIRKEIFKNKPNIDLGKSYHNLGFFCARNHQYKAAKIALNGAIEVYKNLDVSRMLRSYFELGYIHDEEGEYELAENCLNLVIKKGKEIDDKKLLGKALLNLGGVKLEKEEYNKAILLFEQALPNLKGIGDFENEAKCFQNIGIASYLLNDFPKAIKNYKEAISIFEELENCYEVGMINSNLGRAYGKNKNDKLASVELQKALKIALDCGDPEIIASSHDNLGEYHLEKSDFKTALKEYQNAIKTIVPIFKPKTDFENPKEESLVNVSNKIDLLVYLSDKARALQGYAEKENNKDHLNSTLDIYKLGDKLIDQLRQEHSDEGTKLFWREKVIPFYENAIEICHDLEDGESAFFFFEKSRAVLLLEALQNSDALAAIPDSVRNTSYKIRKQLIGARQDLEDANEKERSNKLQYLIEIQKSFDDFNLQLSKKYPQVASVKFETEVIERSDFRLLLSTSLLPLTSIHYFYGEKNIYALVTDQSQSSTYDLGTTKSIEPEIRKLLSFFKNASEIENAPSDYISQAYKIYSLLVKPLNLNSAQDLLIFPDGALAYLPFEALTSANEGNISSAAYLIKNHTFRYAYSATILANQKNIKISKPNNTIAAFAPFAKLTSNPAHPVLSFSEDELGQIQKQVAGVFLEDRSASKAKLLENRKQHAVLHLSTHAFSSPSEDKPKIIFSDSALYLSELYTLQIPSNLVVLSACQTNIGKLSPGEGVMSLGRGFTYAGAKSLISSLWNVNANSTGVVLSDFYKNLQMKVPKHLALHQAKKSFLENENLSSFNRSPYYWAGLIYYGDAVPLVLKQPNPWNSKSLMLGALIVFVLTGWYFFRKKKTM